MRNHQNLFGNITGVGGSIVLSGTGNQILSGSNSSYSGGTTILSGTLTGNSGGLNGTTTGSTFGVNLHIKTDPPFVSNLNPPKSSGYLWLADYIE